MRRWYFKSNCTSSAGTSLLKDVELLWESVVTRRNGKAHKTTECRTSRQNDKYTKVKKVRLYTCFVDLRKAFDTVCRDLLLHKISCLGISGNFFDCLSDMYKKSIAHIKISKLLSPKIDIGKGTEQGHPLSPDLFKFYINDFLFKIMIIFYIIFKRF